MEDIRSPPCFVALTGPGRLFAEDSRGEDVLSGHSKFTPCSKISWKQGKTALLCLKAREEHGGLARLFLNQSVSWVGAERMKTSLLSEFF